MKYIDEFRNPVAAEKLAHKIKSSGTRMRIMEVCGTHTMAIARSALRPLLSPDVELISGPGCPVCVTSDTDIDRAIAISLMPDVVLATFGDMMRVPGSESSLSDAKAKGALVRVVYSPLEALKIAKEQPDKKVVFLGIGFETTAPAVAATVLKAKDENVSNFYVLSLHKLIPPALKALLSTEDLHLDGLILPGHVSAIIGSKPYEFIPREFGIPCVIAGFEPLDILSAISMISDMKKTNPAVEIGYARAVRPEGNPKALNVMYSVFEKVSALWRGISEIPQSGLDLKSEFAQFSASSFDVELPEPKEKKGCVCGDVIRGRVKPNECPLFGKSCTPESPVGPCMVSSEGTCASYYIYGD